jgi:predicted extracellular nuclease/phosphodiesterase/alkaline phosphatase D-like protein
MPVSFTGTYGQNFDGLASSGTNNAWTNDLTLPGWHLFRQPAASPVAITSYNADTGTATSGNFLSYGSSGSSDRALGGLGSGGVYFSGPSPAPAVPAGSVAGWFALALSNATATPITNLAIAFNGEQWRNGGNTTAQTMVLEYGYGASFEQVASWTAPGGTFNWSSPVATAPTGAAVDGNNAGRVGNLGGTLNLSASPWAANATLWLRWIENNDAGGDHGLAIDDLTIATVQAPAQPEVAIQAIVAQAGEFGGSASVRISRTGSTAAALEVPISLVAGAGLATAADLTTPFPASITIPEGAASADLALSPLDDSLDEGTETLRIQITAPAGTTLAASGASVDLTLFDNDRISLISAVQGTGATSPLLDQSVTLRAVVVGDFQLSSELGGFFLQEESADWDTSALSSEGLYVAYPFSGGNVDVQLGDRVLVSGVVSERFNQTILSSIQALTVEASGRLADTRRVDIPDLLAQRSASLDLEPYEGMWVRFPETLTVNGLYGQFRFGELELSAGGLPIQPTNVMEPGAAAYAAEQATALRELVLDDGSNSSYRPANAATSAAPVRDQLLRRGDTITAVEGVLAYDFSKYRLQPTAPLSFSTADQRPPAPAAAAAGQLRLASFNVLNTFTTLNTTGALTDSGLAPRGANTPEELERQLSKLTTALLGLKADVIGLMELENDSDDATLGAIVQRLNAAQPSGSGRNYSYVPTGLIGSDAIKVGLIYNNLAVAASGTSRVLDTTAFTDPLASGTPKNRPALAQTFRELASGETVNVVVNHLKSKGATDATGADLDQRDGQSAFNATRTAAAARLLEWIQSNPTGNGDPDWVVLGDLNAYAKEDPIQVFEAAGYRNALPSFTDEPPSSYAFFTPVDMSGALDHMLISPSLVPQAIAASDWSINAAEAAFRDYNRDTNSNGNADVRDFFTADPYRTSDHDPVMLDLDLGRTIPAGLAFSHGVASGDPYADSVILWTRITPPTGFSGLVDVQWEVASSADFSAESLIDSGSFSTGAARDWTVKVEADGLVADTTYYYRFGAGESVSITGQTKTLPTGSDPVRLAVFSCANFPAAEEFAAYGRAVAIHQANPYDALLHLGDYIYEYGPGGYGSAEDAAADRGFLPNREIISLDDYRQRYAQYHTDINLQSLRAAAPLIAGWDDHETANNSWAGGAQNHQSPEDGDWLERRDAALKAYYEWLPIREPGQRQASDGATALSPLTQAYRSFSFGDVLTLHMLETRLTARDQQLEYPREATVQARIGAILADPAQVASYATKAGAAPPTSIEGFPAFGAAIAPLVAQELVIATVQQGWADPSRDLIGDTQLAWLQQQMAGSSAAWQVLGQQVLMQSMAVPSELLLAAQSLDFNDPASGAQLTATLDKYAGPLQKLATGTPFASLSPAEQALFAEAGKIPYNLDAWDGYGVERETILQTALALGKRLISLAGDTHNAWAGVLDTMSAGSKPAGTVAGVEYGTPGVTSPGFEKYLPGADAYIRAMYPAVDGLDGLFLGYVDGLKDADLNRRGFLDLTVSKEQVVGSFQLLNGTDPVSGKPLWSSESVVSSASYGLSTSAEARPLISWQPGWRELDLVFGMAVDGAGGSTLLDPAVYASVPREGIQLADVTVQGSAAAERIYAGVGSTVDLGPGSDELFNTDSLGGNVLVGGTGLDRFVMRAADDSVIGGSLQANADALGLPPVVALVDGERDTFLIDSSNPAPAGRLRILDYEPGVDQILLDGVTLQTPWPQTRSQLQSLNIDVNAAPQLNGSPGTYTFKRGLEVSQDFASFVSDADTDPLTLLKLNGPDWITSSGTTLLATAPGTFSEQDLAALSLKLAFSDGKALVPFALKLALFNAPPTGLSLSNAITRLAENTSTANRIKVADVGIADDGVGSHTISLSGADAASFEVSGSALYLKAGINLNFEAKAAYAVSLSASDPALPGSTPVTASYSLAISDINEAPTAISLRNRVSSLPEDASTAARIKLAEIVISDDALGSNSVSLTGPDAGSFEIDAGALFLRQGVALSQVTKASYQVQISVDDPAVGISPDAFTPFELTITPARPRQNGQLEVNVPDGAGGTRQVPVTIAGADLKPATTLNVIANLGLNPSSLTTLGALNITPSSGGVDFQLSVDPALGSGTVTSLLDLVAADLKGNLSGPAGRIPTRRLLYYALDGAGAATPLSFDPISNAGARFYDINNDGIEDLFTLSLVDGGYGDKDGTVNGFIDDPSFAAVADLDPGFSASASNTLTVSDAANPQLPAAVALRISLASRPDTANSLYYVVLSPAELANPNAILGNLNSLRSRAQLLLSTLERTDFTLPTGSQFQRDILLLNGQAGRLFEVADATLNEIRSLNDARLRFLDPRSVTSKEAQFSSISGVNFALSVQPGSQGLNALVGQQQSLAPVLDLTAFRTTQTVSGTVAIGREALFDSVTGFYRCLDASGAVRAADGVTTVRPGDVNYQAEALRAANQVAAISSLQVGDRQTNSRSFDLNESAAIAPFARVGANTYFAYAAANLDGISHFRTLGTNLFGFEDQFGGGDLDFDDLVFGFNFTKVV